MLSYAIMLKITNLHTDDGQQCSKFKKIQVYIVLKTYIAMLRHIFQPTSFMQGK